MSRSITLTTIPLLVGRGRTRVAMLLLCRWCRPRSRALDAGSSRTSRHKDPACQRSGLMDPNHRGRAPRAVARRSVAIVGVASLGLIHSMTSAAQSPVGSASASPNPATGVAPSRRQWIEIHNTDLRISDSVVIRIARLQGEVVRTIADQPARLDDPKSFRIHVTAGRVALTGSD